MMTITTESLESLFKTALRSLSTVSGDVDYSNQLLSKLISETSVLASTVRLDPSSPVLHEFLHRCGAILISPKTPPLTRSKLQLLLSNLFLYNVSLRKAAANSDQLCLAVFHCLRIAIDEHLGTQNVIDVLRLLLMITYERVNFGDWIYQLLPILTEEIMNSHPSELLPYSICILCNLVSQSKAFSNRLKQMDSFKSICSRILQLLSHTSKAVVISALVLVGYLDEKTRDTVYSSQNISQTFLCIFNILTSASTDVLMTTHIAIDLLQRLVVIQPKSPNDVPLLNPTARSLSSYAFFEKSIQKVAELLNMFDPKSEESRKIFHLLLSFCQLDELRLPTSMAIVATEPSEHKLNTPAHALLRTALLRFDDTVFPEVTLTALQLLTIVVKEAIEAGKGVRRLFPSIEPMCTLIRQTMRAVSFDPSSPLAPFSALQMAEGLRLAEALTNDEDFRFDLLDIANARQCAEIFEQQLTSNPIVHHLLVPSTSSYNHEPVPSTSSSSKDSSFPMWSINAIAIPIQLMRLLAALKDYSKAHKDLYWRSLKDTRLLPFIAYTILRGNNELVYDALVLFTHCAQVHDFPIRRLSRLITKCALLKKSKTRNRLSTTSDECPINSSKNVSFSLSSPEVSHEYSNGMGESSKGMDGMVKMIDQLRNRLAIKEKREKELEKKLLTQQSSGRMNGGLSTEGAVPDNIRRFVADLERHVVESDAERAALVSEKAELVHKVGEFQTQLEAERTRHLAEMRNEQKEREVVEEENERERSLHAVLRAKFDEMTRKFDTAAKVIFDKQSEFDRMTKAEQEWVEKMAERERELERNRTELEEARRIIGDRESELAEKAKELEQFRVQNQQLNDLRTQMARLLKDFDAKSE